MRGSLRQVSEPGSECDVEYPSGGPVVGKNGEPLKRAESPDSPHWSTLWVGPPFVVYGHTPRPAVEATKWTLGIDTGCVLGDYLTAYILPEKRIVQVKAREKYFRN